MRKVLIASIAPAIVVAARGIMIAGGNGPVKGIRMAGVVIEDAHYTSTGCLGETRVEALRRLRSWMLGGTLRKKVLKIQDSSEIIY